MTYTLTENGHVYNEKGIRLKSQINNFGYKSLHLCSNGNKNRFYLHQLMGEVYLGGRKAGMVVNHKNGIKTDNKLSNLEVVTISEDAKHAYKTGLRRLDVKLNKEKRFEIKRLLLDGYSGVGLARMFDVTPATISYIKNTWKGY